MGYIGSKPATNFETVRKQVSTTNSGTTITLDYSVSSVQDILVTVNAVVQSYDNYSVSGTTLTLGGTLNNDRVEILYVGRTFQTVTPAVGTVTNDMLSGSIANSKLANSSITLNGSAVSLGGSATTNFFASTGFSAYIGSTQTLTSGAQVTLTFDTERYDLGNNFNTSTYAYTPPSTGYYMFNFAVSFRGGANTNLARCNVGMQKASSTYQDWEKNFSASYVLNAGTSATVFANVTDTDAYKLFVNVTDQSGNPSVLGTITNSYFEGYRIA